MNLISCQNPHTFYDFEVLSHLLSQQCLLPTEGSWSAQSLLGQKPLAILLPYFCLFLSSPSFLKWRELYHAWYADSQHNVPCCAFPSYISNLPFDLSWALSCHFQKLSCSKTFPEQLDQSFSLCLQQKHFSPVCITFCLSTSICIFHFIILHHLLH